MEEEIYNIVKNYDENNWGRIVIPTYKAVKCANLLGFDYKSLSKTKRTLFRAWLIDCAQGCNSPANKIKETILS